VELLRCVAEGVGLLRARGDRLEATSLRHAWTQIDQALRAGLTYAAWCQQVTLLRGRPKSVASQAPELRECEIGITPFDCPRDNWLASTRLRLRHACC
jgi:hypothetical protein